MSRDWVILIVGGAAAGVFQGAFGSWEWTATVTFAIGLMTGLRSERARWMRVIGFIKRGNL